jgi:hypothetical protein
MLPSLLLFTILLVSNVEGSLESSMGAIELSNQDIMDVIRGSLRSLKPHADIPMVHELRTYLKQIFNVDFVRLIKAVIRDVDVDTRRGILRVIDNFTFANADYSTTSTLEAGDNTVNAMMVIMIFVKALGKVGKYLQADRESDEVQMLIGCIERILMAMRIAASHIEPFAAYKDLYTLYNNFGPVVEMMDEMKKTLN